MNVPTRITATAAVVIVSMALAAGTSAQTVSADVCTSLAEQRLLNATITVAQPVTGGSFTPPGGSNAITNLPPFCRVVGEIRPTSDSHILFEVWLPLQEWNGKFAGVGNGGWAGTISFGDLAEELRRHYASASTNTGHEAAPGEDMAKFAFDHPEQLIDFAYRAHHETTMKAKALVQAFYGRSPAHAYWFGCSSGGYEGLMEAQRFPADFDGIVAGAPANNFTRLMAGDLDATLAVLKDPASLLSPSALGLLYRRVIAICDRADGVADGVLEDPRQCRFDPADLKCAANVAPDACLTPAQVEAARRIYRGPKDPATGAQLYPGLAVSSEPFWPNRDPARPFPIPISYYKWLVFGDPQWDWRTLDFSNPAAYQAVLAGERKFAPILNATNPDLREFRRQGGKLIQYHGWSDELIAAQNSIDYYESVVSFFGAGQADRSSVLRDLQSFYRLFMVPGMAHCGGGPGPNEFDTHAALEQWVERGIVPEQIVATHSINHRDRGVVDRLRPLCPYPKVAVYSGKGDTNEATSFVCREPSMPPGRRGTHSAGIVGGLSP